jgi:hypothetical protein
MLDLVSSVTEIDWSDVEEVERRSHQVLHTLASHDEVLRTTLSTVADRPELMDLCEHYDILDKIVLFDDPDRGVRIRLHVFLPGYFDRPHNHRWSYASLILKGSYRHYLYGTDENVDESIDARTLKPVMVRRESVGSLYTLHHSMVHAVVAEPYTMSLVIRGPAVKERFIVMDRKTGKSWWQFGAKNESRAITQGKRMTRERFAKISEIIAAGDVFN